MQLSEITVGNQVLLVTTEGARSRGTVSKISELLPATNIEVLDEIEPNPEIEHVDRFCSYLSGKPFDQIIAVGGGSTLDTAKALSVGLEAARQGQSIRKYLRDSRLLSFVKPVSMIAIPTTSGTGSEVTPFATLWDKEENEKHSLSSPVLYPGTAIIDPSLMLSLPVETTIFTGLDALSHAFESVWSRRCIPLTMSFAVRAIRLVFDALTLLEENPNSVLLREKMAEGSMLSGLAIAHTRTAVCHAISYPITSHFGMPHGLACSFTHPSVLRFNSQVDDGRLKEVAHQLQFSSTKALAEYLEKFLSKLKITQNLRDYIPNRSILLELTSELFQPGRADKNMRNVSVEEMQRIISE